MNDNTVAAKGFAYQAARASWICPLLIFVLIVVGGRSGARVLVEVVTLAMMCVGALLAVIALFGIPKYGRRGILGQAITGLVLNGLLLSIFLTNFLAARAKVAAGM